MANLIAKSKNVQQQNTLASTDCADIFSHLCSRLLGDIKRENVLRERSLVDFSKTLISVIGDSLEKLPASFDELADRISEYWLYETDRETNEERKYSYIRLYQMVCVLMTFRTERELDEKSFSAMEKNRYNQDLVHHIGQKPGITRKDLSVALQISIEALTKRTDTLEQEGFLFCRRAGEEQFYFLSTAGERLQQYLTGSKTRYAIQRNWSHERVQVMYYLLERLPKSIDSIPFMDLVVRVDDLSDEKIHILLERLNVTEGVPLAVSRDRVQEPPEWSSLVIRQMKRPPWKTHFTSATMNSIDNYVVSYFQSADIQAYEYIPTWKSEEFQKRRHSR